LFYVGAGTSGRLGVLDAAENPPTFGVKRTMVQGIIAGGPEALRRSMEGAEDKYDDGARSVQKRGVSPEDVVVGIAASRRTPFVLGALEKAREIGAKTVFVMCNPPGSFAANVDVKICPVVGPEVLTGSTRLKAATAQKMILNMLTTAAMVKTGKTYGNLMVDLKCYSDKLTERAKRIIMRVTGVRYDRAARALKHADGETKTAIVMLAAGVDADEARRRLSKHKGFVRKAIQG
jgi:N-acetylmuramic acid 6-phosphate etherase